MGDDRCISFCNEGKGYLSHGDLPGTSTEAQRLVTPRDHLIVLSHSINHPNDSKNACLHRFDASNTVKEGEVKGVELEV
jgi:hypothetical protein